MKQSVRRGQVTGKVALVALLSAGAWACSGKVDSSSFTSSRPAASASTTKLAAPPFVASDVAILFPLPTADTAHLLVRPSTSHDPSTPGSVITRETFARVLPSGSLDPAEPSTFDDTAVVAVRIDMNYSGASCSAEVRAVVQGLYVDSTGLVQAADGSLHITYCATHPEVTELARAIRDARLASPRPDGEPPVGVHPLLASEGLGGPFAIKLRGLLLPVMASSKIRKITVYDHSRDEAGHKWKFSVFDCASGNCNPVNIPSTNGLTQTVEGSDPHAPLAASFAKIAVGAASRDPVARLVAPDRPAPGSPEAASLATVFESSLRIEQPKLHNSRSTDCVNCHLAEGARRIGTAFYGLDANASTSFGVDVDRRDDRTSVSNLHAFGYLGREVSVMRRTALEATETAARMTALKL